MKNVVAFLLWVVACLLVSVGGGIALSQWAEEAAFSNFSKTHIRKTKKQYSYFERILLTYLLRFSKNKRVYRRVVAYWCNWLLAVIVAVTCTWSDLIPNGIDNFIFYSWAIIQAILCFLWLQKNKKIKKD